MLASDLDSSVEADRAVLDRLLELLVAELDIQPEEGATEDRTEKKDSQQAVERLEQLVSDLDSKGEEMTPPVHERTNRREFQLIIMRLLSEYCVYSLQDTNIRNFVLLGPYGGIRNREIGIFYGNFRYNFFKQFRPRTFLVKCG